MWVFGADLEKSKKCRSARDSLPKNLHEVYRQIVAEYAYYIL